MRRKKNCQGGQDKKIYKLNLKIKELELENEMLKTVRDKLATSDDTEGLDFKIQIFGVKNNYGVFPNLSHVFKGIFRWNARQRILLGDVDFHRTSR